jgi:hypothetical protein
MISEKTWKFKGKMNKENIRLIVKKATVAMMKLTIKGR